MDLKRLVGNTSLKKEKLEYINKTLEEQKFIEFKDTRTKELIKVKVNSNQEDLKILIKDFKHPSLYYLKYIGEKISECERCGCLIKKTSNRKKYCLECSKIAKKESTSKSKQFIKNNKSVLEENRNDTIL